MVPIELYECMKCFALRVCEANGSKLGSLVGELVYILESADRLRLNWADDVRVHQF